MSYISIVARCAKMKIVFLFFYQYQFLFWTALSVIVFSSLKNIYRWQEEDLDIALFLRDELYKSSNTQQYFSATASLNIVSVYNIQVQTSHIRNNYGKLLKN